MIIFLQIDRATNNKSQAVSHEEQQDESEDEDVDDVLYGVDEESEIDSDSDD